MCIRDSNIELLLDYCMRFYERQFITRSAANKDILMKFEALIDDYFQSDKPQTEGLPSCLLYTSSTYALSPGANNPCSARTLGVSPALKVRRMASIHSLSLIHI